VGGPEDVAARGVVLCGCGLKGGDGGITFDKKRRVPGDRGGRSKAGDPRGEFPAVG